MYSNVPTVDHDVHKVLWCMFRLNQYIMQDIRWKVEKNIKGILSLTEIQGILSLTEFQGKSSLTKIQRIPLLTEIQRIPSLTVVNVLSNTYCYG